MENQKETIRVRVPASSANLGPGFDTLGIALQLYSYVSVEASPTNQNEVVMQGEGSEYGQIPIEENIAWQAIVQLARRLKSTFPPLRLTVENSIPLARGLGSSAAARVGAIVATNLWLQRVGENYLDQQGLLELATELEGHPDNVASALFGGMTASVCDEGKVLSSPVNTKFWPQFLVFIPSTELETKTARGVLPESVSRHDAIYNVSRLGLLVATLGSGTWQNNSQLLKTALQDKLHQPYRASLMPAFDAVQNAALENGALGVTLSGAGPSILIWLEVGAKSTFKESVKSIILQTATMNGVLGEVIELEVDTQGCVMDD
ncbi:MAG: homoserine kinase [Abditibacteriaceae bacterium]